MMTAPMETPLRRRRYGKTSDASNSPAHPSPPTPAKVSRVLAAIPEASGKVSFDESKGGGKMTIKIEVQDEEQKAKVQVFETPKRRVSKKKRSPDASSVVDVSTPKAGAEVPRTPCTGKSASAKARKADKSGKPQKPKVVKCKYESSIDMVEQIARRITTQCQNIRSASKVIAALRRCVGQPLFGRVITIPEVEEAWCRCLGFFKEDEVLSSGGEGSSDSSSGSDAGSSHQKQSSPSRQKRDLAFLENMMADQEEELSGEEQLDEEEEETEEAGSAKEGFRVEWPPRDVVEVDDGYPTAVWLDHSPELQPGSEGFNKRCTDVMRTVGVAQKLHTELQDGVACPPLQPHQESVAFLLHPKSPVNRLLIDHPTGSGKTWEIIRVLDNYFHDPRPKVPIFPKSPVCRNFYAELLRWPNRYRDYFCCVQPAHAALVSGCCDWREKRMCMWPLNHFLEEELRHLCYTIREVLEMKNMFYMGSMRPGLRKEFEEANPGEAMPAGPMRALSYTSAGGSYTTLRDMEDIPRSAIMKIGYTSGCNNVYTNKVVVMDEAHNLVRTKTIYGEQLKCLRDLLVKADNLVLAGFTGTPILNEPEEGRQLLDIIKGIKAPTGDDGYLSSFPMRPQKLFPVSLPRGLPDALLTKQLQDQVVVPVQLSGESMRLYDKKRREGLTGRMLAAYCNVCYYFGTFHDGKNGKKEKVLQEPADCCPKLMRIATEVAESPQKGLILISKQSGYAVMLELMRQVAAASNPPFAVATIDELTSFNHVSNIRGEKYRVMVADASQCSEGVSFLAVRRVFLADVASSPSQLIQQCGRSIRMFGHQGLPEEEQVVVNRMYVAVLPKWQQTPLASWVFRLLRHVKDGENEAYAKKMLTRLRRVGIADLKELKDRIDEFGEKKLKSLHRGAGASSSEKQPLESADIVMFLELAGLWDDVQSQPSQKPQTSKGGSKPKLVPQVAGQSARFAALAAGSARLAALTNRLVGAAPPRNAPGQGLKKKATGSDHLLVSSVKAASRTLELASKAYNDLTVALRAVSEVCDQIDKFTPPESWQGVLHEGLEHLRQNEIVAGALRASANPAFNCREGELNELTAREVKLLHHNLSRAEKSLSLTSAYLAVQGLCTENENVTSNEDAWKETVEKEVGALVQRESVFSALREIAPSAYAARTAGGLRELTFVQVQLLRDALKRQRSSDKMSAPWSQTTLVRAVRDLYLAKSLEDAMVTLEAESADEQALRKLADRQAEFVPALAALREKAIDCNLFETFREPEACLTDSEEAEEPDGAMDVEEDNDGPLDNEPQPVQLEEGWRLEWVAQSQMRGKAAKDQYRFVDPAGRKYFSVLELRTAMSSGHEAVEEIRRTRREAKQLEAAEKPVVVRTKRNTYKKKSRCRLW